jgi:dTMP kinase
MSGLFITLEGIDGCGKSTQAALLVDWLRSRGYHVRATREPGGTEAGEPLRELLLSPERVITPEAELFLYLADRSLHVAQLVRPALAEGRVVVCERHADSTLAYQGAGRGLDMELLRRLNAVAAGGLVPDLTIILDVPPDKVRLDEARLDRLELEGRDFSARVAEGFRTLARQEPGRVKLVDGTGDIATVHGRVAAVVNEILLSLAGGSNSETQTDQPGRQ